MKEWIMQSWLKYWTWWDEMTYQYHLINVRIYLITSATSFLPCLRNILPHLSLYPIASVTALVLTKVSYQWIFLFKISERKLWPDCSQWQREGFWRPEAIDHFGALHSPSLMSRGLRSRPFYTQLEGSGERCKLRGGIWGLWGFSCQRFWCSLRT